VAVFSGADAAVADPSSRAAVAKRLARAAVVAPLRRMAVPERDARTAVPGLGVLALVALEQVVRLDVAAVRKSQAAVAKRPARVVMAAPEMQVALANAAGEPVASSAESATCWLADVVVAVAAVRRSAALVMVAQAVARAANPVAAVKTQAPDVLVPVARVAVLVPVARADVRATALRQLTPSHHRQEFPHPLLRVR
jgi:hypothetical protein